MTKHRIGSATLVIGRKFDRSGKGPLHRQLYQLVRQLIVEGEIAAGAKLPSSRLLADELGVSRHTVSTAVDQLVGEGYVVGRRGSGTYVSHRFGRRQQNPEKLISVEGDHDLLSRRGSEMAAAPRSPFKRLSAASGESLAFKVGLPAVDLFPSALWSRALSAAWKDSSPSQLGYQSPLGHEGLRESVAAYLRASRGLICRPDQVVIVAGSQSALDLCFRTLIDPGDVVAIEDPGYLGARAAAIGAGASIAGVSVDSHGLDSTWFSSMQTPPRVVFVTPTHQFPLGVTMSLERRLLLTRWAARNKSWILEDDYDSEFRYSGRSLDPLAVLDQAERVIYVGTFSKVLFPALRLGYLVVPSSLVDAFEAAHLSSDIHRPLLEQAALMRFMDGGHFTRHLRRTREAHAERREALISQSALSLEGLIDVQAAQAGLHLFGQLPDATDDIAVARAAAERGLDVWPLSPHAIADQRRGLLLGYGAVPPPFIGDGVQRLASIIRRMDRRVSQR